MRLHQVLLIILTLVLEVACSSVEYAPDQAPHMVVVNDGIPFFLHGPAQGNGPDKTLVKGDEVQVLRKEFGYSFVQLEDGQKGFVANEELATAPPRPKPTPTPAPDAIPSFWPREKPLTEIPFPSGESNAPVTPPQFRY